jgi:hypothetical protein
MDTIDAEDTAGGAAVPPPGPEAWKPEA